MKRKTPTTFDLVFGLIILLALGLRVVFSAVWVFSEKEAAMVLGIRANPTTIYQIWTGLLFTIFEQSEFLGRILPILFGTGFVFLPLLIRDRLTDAAVLLIALGLALDPGLIAISKQAGPEMLAISAFFSLLLFLITKRWAAAGISLAIGLLSGPYFWIGGLTLLIGLAIAFLFFNKPDEETGAQTIMHYIRSIQQDVNWKTLFSAFGISTVLAGTLFLTQPLVLAGITGSVISFFQRENQDFQALSFSVALIGFFVAYFSLIIFGFLGSKQVAKPWRNVLWFWLLVTFLLVSLFPGRQLADYIWIVIPLYIPAAYFLTNIKMRSTEKPLVIIGISAILSVFGLYFIFSLSQYIGQVGILQEDSQSMAYLISAVSSFIILVLILVVLAWGWSLYLSRDSLIVLCIGFLVLVYIVPSLKSTGFDAQPKQLMWFQTSYFEDFDLFRKTITQLDQNRLVKDKPLSIQLENSVSNTLLWELRNNEVEIKQSGNLPDENEPDVIITDDQESPLVTDNRMGQDIIISKTPAWSLMTTKEWIRWVTYQEPLYNNLQIIIWAYPYEGSLEVSIEP